MQSQIVLGRKTHVAGITSGHFYVNIAQLLTTALLSNKRAEINVLSNDMLYLLHDCLT